MNLSPQHKRVIAARAAMLLDCPFFGVLALSLRLQEDSTAPTAWVDGKTLGFNPAFIDTCNNAQLTALIAHEVMHCACGHPWRRGERDHKKFNVACDHAINPILTAAGMTLPDGGLDDPQYHGKCAEWIYDRLGPDQDQQGGQGQGDSQGEVRDAPADDGEGDTPTEADWQQATAQAKRAGRGAMAGGLKEAINEATRARTDWRTLLRKYLQEAAKADYSWSKPNPRYTQGGLYLPALNAPSFGHLAIAVDTSGSIDTVLLGQFAAEISDIANDLQPARIDVIYCDTHVHKIDSFERGEHITIEAVGRGGTSFEPVFEHYDTETDQPAVLVYLTDLDGSFPDIAPSYPVIWVAYGTSQVAPFGETVNCE